MSEEERGNESVQLNKHVFPLYHSVLKCLEDILSGINSTSNTTALQGLTFKQR